jgi:signal peptidase I
MNRMTNVVERIKAYRQKKKNAPPPQTFTEHVVAWVKSLAWALVMVTIINGLAIGGFVVPTGSMESTVMAGDLLFVNKAIFGPSTPQIIPFFNIPLPFYKLPALKDPEQGDVIVFIFPGNRDDRESTEFTYYLKRCVAVAGDTLQVIGGRVYVNGTEYPLPEHAQYMSMSAELRAATYEHDRLRTFPAGRNWTRDDYGPLRIPKKGDVIQLSQANIREWATFIRREGHEVNEALLTIDSAPATRYVVERDYVFGMGDNRDNSEDSRYFGFIPEDNVVGTPMIVYWSWAPDDPVRGTQMTFLERLGSIRWSRIGTIIR